MAWSSLEFPGERRGARCRSVAEGKETSLITIPSPRTASMLSVWNRYGVMEFGVWGLEVWHEIPFSRERSVVVIA